MQKFLVLMVICGFVGSANADTLQLADYLADPGVDNPIAGSWGGSWNLDYPSVRITTQPQVEWGRFSNNQHTGVSVVDMGTDAYNGTQAMALDIHMSHGGAYGLMGIRHGTQAVLHPGDTWELNFAIRGVHGWAANQAYPIGELRASILVNGTNYGAQVWPEGSVGTKDDWTVLNASVTYDGTLTKQPGSWSFDIDMQRANNPPDSGTNGYAGVYLDILPIPEPATMSLVGLGILGGLIRRRK